MVKMSKDGKTIEISPERVEKLLKRGFALVTDTPAPEDVDTVHEEQNKDGES